MSLTNVKGARNRGRNLLDTAIQEYVEAVERRIEQGGGGYSEEIGEIRIAASRVKAIHADLGLGDFVKSIRRPTGKPQLLLVFKAGAINPANPEQPLVLKVYGRSRPGEGLTQHALTSSGAVVPTLRFSDKPNSWLLMEYLDVPNLEDKLPCSNLPSTYWTQKVAAATASFSRDAPSSYARSQTLDRAIFRHLDIVTKSLVSHGYSVPADWAEDAHETYGLGTPAGLHNDLFPGNVLVIGENSSQPQVMFVDSSSDGCVGDRAFDAARWIVRMAATGAPEKIAALIDVHKQAWLAGDPNVNRQLLDRMIATELLMQAGVVEIVKAENGLPWSERDTKTIALVDAYQAHRDLANGISPVQMATVIEPRGLFD